MIGRTVDIAGTTAHVAITRPSAYLDHRATCPCGWQGVGWLGFDDAAREARSHTCAAKRPCAARVVVRVPGCVPPSSYRRGCKRYALPGSTTCRMHEDVG